MLEKLARKAIQAALNQSWQEAIKLNEEILAQAPQGTPALNRLALAQNKLGQINKAKKTFKQVLKLDPSNPIATRNLARLKFSPKIPTKGGEPLSPVELFLQEPGKTKIVELINPAGPEILAKVSLGEKLSIVPRRKTLVLMKNGACLGSLPEDLSFRLSSLIKKGNRYEVALVRADPKKILALIKEVFRSKGMKGSPSFF